MAALRQEVTDLQKNSVKYERISLEDILIDIVIDCFSVSGLPVNDKVMILQQDYNKAKDEILTLYREKGEVSFVKRMSLK